jgi:capsular polysaccharide biosynthesis protein/Mrp family chromosome partitioning ATPase
MASPRPDSLEISDYLGVLRRRWWIALLLVIVGAAGSVGYIKVAPKVYSASVLIQVNPLPSNASAVAGRTSGSVNMDNEAQLVQSVLVARIAARMMHTDLTPPKLAEDVSVSVPPNTTFLQVKCGQPSVTEAVSCADSFAKAYLANRRDTTVNSINIQLNAKTAQIGELTTKVARLKTQVNHLPPTSPAHVRAQTSLAAAQTLLSADSEASNKLVQFLGNLSVPGYSAVGAIATPAARPLAPSSPRKILVIPSGVLAGLILGLLVAFLVDFRDRRIHGVRDVERFLDLPVLVNLVSGKTRMTPVLVSPRSKAGQAFTELGQYVAASLGDGSHVVFVAGTSTGPGCSVLAANLAATLARTRADVTLVCADPHGTVTPELLEVADGRGLSEVLAGTATVADVVRPAPDERRLRVITPGLDTSGALLNLQYEASRRLLSELRRDYRYVIVEVQSVGEDSSAFALAEFADAAVMAVETMMTTRTAAADCLQRLDRLRTSVLGAVVLPAPSSKGARPLPDVRSDRLPAEPAPRPAVSSAATSQPRPAPAAPRPSEERRRPAGASGANGRPAGGPPSVPGSAGLGTSASTPPRVRPETKPLPSVLSGGDLGDGAE